MVVIVESATGAGLLTSAVDSAGIIEDVVVRVVDTAVDRPVDRAAGVEPESAAGAGSPVQAASRSVPSNSAAGPATRSRPDGIRDRAIRG
jgi:hypothetical protein